MQTIRKTYLKLIAYYSTILVVIIISLLILNGLVVNSNFYSSLGFILILIEVVLFILVIYEISRESSSLIVNSYNERYIKRRLNEGANLQIKEFQSNEVKYISLLLLANTSIILIILLLSW